MDRANTVNIVNTANDVVDYTNVQITCFKCSVICTLVVLGVATGIVYSDIINEMTELKYSLILTIAKICIVLVGTAMCICFGNWVVVSKVDFMYFMCLCNAGVISTLLGCIVYLGSHAYAFYISALIHTADRFMIQLQFVIHCISVYLTVFILLSILVFLRLVVQSMHKMGWI